MTGIPQDFEFEVDNIPQQKTHKGQVFPLVLRPRGSSTLTTADQWTNWAQTKKGALIDLLTKYGAILFKGLPMKGPGDFDKFVKAFGYSPYPYIGGAAPRTVVTGDVFTSNESPLDKPIPFHHEISQVPNPPAVLFFYCEIPPKFGGQTPIVSSVEAYDQMAEKEPAFVARLEKEGIQYNRVLPDGDDRESIIGRGWQGTFDATTREEAETAATKKGITFSWTADGCMRTTSATLPAIRQDARTGRKAWFNTLGTAWLAWQDNRNERKKAVTFPSGEIMPEEAMQTMVDTLEDLAVDFDWEEADICMIDNRQVLHARRAGVGPRRILAALCKE